ncbi:hypothetical protein AAKU55_001657 [Oxalobacteraceae bacterium GrIS 1.11]
MSQQINLYNPLFRKQKKYLAAATMAQALGLVLVCALALVVYGQQRVGALERQAGQIQTELDLLEARKARSGVDFPPRVRSKAIELELAQAESDHKALQDVATILLRGEFGNTKGYSAYFRAFAHNRVTGLWLTGVSIVGAGNEIGLQGRTLQAGLVPGYISGLSRQPVLQGKSFGRLDIAQAPLEKSAAVPRYLEFSLQAAPAPPLAGALVKYK